MECTLEKTKKIKKIQEKVRKEKESEIVKLKQKVNDMWKQRAELEDSKKNEETLNDRIIDMTEKNQDLNYKISRLLQDIKMRIDENKRK
jgi:hypothetical protein